MGRRKMSAGGSGSGVLFTTAWGCGVAWAASLRLFVVVAGSLSRRRAGLGWVDGLARAGGRAE